MSKRHRIWSLQEAKAKFGEVVRLAQTEGPQVVTVHGKAAVTINPARPDALQDGDTGSSLVELLGNSPLGLLPERAMRRVKSPARNRAIEL